ncbi:MAG: PASTA domain-containing protein [Candidatus Sulfotelmatobacter sp.]
MKPLFRIAFLALVMLLVAMVSALAAMRFAIHGQEVQVPAIVGMTPSEAERKLAGSGLEMDVERQYYSPQIPEGKIMTQLPMPGTKVRRGWEVRVAQSMGPQRVSIPDVTGESERAAELNLRRRGLELSSTAELQMLAMPPNQVLAQSPPANASQVAAPKTSLLISTPADPQAFVMPSFVGQPLGTATRIVQDAGFKLGNVTVAPAVNPQTAGATTPSATTSGVTPPVTPPAIAVPPSQPTPASIIVSQTPPAGQKILAGAMVTFEVR